MAADVIVVGAGLAGLSCAFELASRGRRVLVLEGKGVVGGRTSSWSQDGMPVESGLHRFLGFYRALPALLRRAGIDPDDILVWEDAVEIRLPEGGPSGVFGLAPMHHPLRTLAGLLGNNALLPPLEKARMTRFFAAGLRDYYLRPRVLDRVTVAGYAESHGVSPLGLFRILIPLTAGLFFLPPERYSSFALFGLLGQAVPRTPLMRVGAFKGGMTEVMAGPLAAAIARKGGTVRTASPVERILFDGGRVQGVVAGGETLRAPHVVLAASLAPAQSLLRDVMEGSAWAAWKKLPSMPTVTVQLELDGPAMPIDRTTFGPGTAWAAFSEQSRTTFRHARGRLSIILSPPERYLAMRPEDVLAETVREGKRLGIPLEGKIRQARVVSLPQDFYSLAPGSEALRPGQATPVPGLVLAGDYTRQPFLATMEGAVLSGKQAAALVLGARPG